MNRSTCESCRQQVPGWNIVNLGEREGVDRELCGRCFNLVIARRSGLEDFEHVDFEPIDLIDARGQVHEFHFQLRLLGHILSLESFELRDHAPGGYQFQEIGDPYDDPEDLFDDLLERMERALAVTHLDETRDGLQVNGGNTLRGRIDCDHAGARATPVMIVDGREISWDEFGRMLSSYEGWQFRLELVDKSDEV